MRARFRDQLDDRRALDRLQLVDLSFEGDVPRVRHRYAFHGCPNPVSDKNVPSAWAGRPAGGEQRWLLLRPSRAWTFPVHSLADTLKRVRLDSRQFKTLPPSWLQASQRVACGELVNQPLRVFARRRTIPSQTP